MTRHVDKWEYFSITGERLTKRSNFSPLKLTLLKGLYKMDRMDMKPDRYDDKFQNRFYNVGTITRFVKGEAAFKDGIINESIRTVINRSLKALYYDGYVELTGEMRKGYEYREFNKNHWMISREGIRVLAADYNKCLPSYLRDNRYVGFKGIYSRKNVVKVLMDDSWTYEDRCMAGDPEGAFNAQKKLSSTLQ